jgi:hypothetical protein
LLKCEEINKEAEKQDGMRKEVGTGISEWGEESEVTAAACLPRIIISLLSYFTCR